MVEQHEQPKHGEAQMVEICDSRTSIQNGEYLLRMNFLYQAAELVAQAHPDSSCAAL